MYWGEWNILTQVPKLTHACIEGTTRVRDVLKLLFHCPRLKHLIVARLTSDRKRRDLDAVYRVEDDHAVLLEVESYVVDVIFDWEKGTNGGMDTWIFSGIGVLAHDHNSKLSGWFLIHLVWALKK